MNDSNVRSFCDEGSSWVQKTIGGEDVNKKRQIWFISGYWRVCSIASGLWLDSSGKCEFRLLQLAFKCKRLRNFADEYAATGKAAQLRKTIATLSLLREEWEATERIPPDVKDVEATKEILRLNMENQFQGLDGSEAYSANSLMGYPNEFNGSSLKPKEIVITFDDGPHVTLTPQVHAIIKELKKFRRPFSKLE